MKKVKILFFSADPRLARPAGQELQLPEELRQIRKAVRHARYGTRLEFEPHGAARADDLIDLIDNTDAEVLHFSGHGGPRGLRFATADGLDRQVVDAEALKRLFQTHPGRVRLAVLSACSSELQAQAIADVVGCAIGTTSGISDDAAITFNSRFYQAIGNGHSVGWAFEKATVALQVHSVPAAEYPRIFVGKGKGIDPARLELVRVPRFSTARVGMAAAAFAATAVALVLPPRRVPPERTASDLACASAGAAGGLEGTLGIAAAATPGAPAGAGGLLATAGELYRARNYDDAKSAFEQAAEAGSGEAMTCLGIIHMYGRGVEPDSQSGFEWVHQAATDERDPHGMYALAMAYLNGVGTDRRQWLAEDWLVKAAAKGHAESMRALGTLSLEARTDSGNVAALDWFRKAEAAGSVDVLVDLGLMHEAGRGVARDPAAALRHYQAAAARDSWQGMFAVGRAYEQGIGVQQDYAKALEWYRTAADEGSAAAMNAIGRLYQEGRGVAKSRRQAIRWYTRATQAGSPVAKGNLAALRGR